MLWPLAGSKIISQGKRRKLDRLDRLKPLLIFFAGTFFSFAPFWAFHIQKVWSGRDLFGKPDPTAPLVFLGATLLVSLLGYYLFPDFLVSGFKPRLSSSKSGGSVFRPLAIACSLLSLVYVLYWVNQHILHSFFSSGDEHSCYFLAECLRKGKFYADIPPLSDFFAVSHVGMQDGKWFSVFPPGWPLIWAFGLQFNVVDWLNPVMSSLAVLFFYLSGARLFGRSATVLGLTFMCLSPFFMFTAASYFSHGTCLLCVSVFLYAFLRWREGYVAGKDPTGWAFLCAFAAGYGLMTRYLTMAAIAGPFLLYHYFSIFFDWRGRDWRDWSSSLQFKRPQIRKSDWIVIGIIAVFGAAILFQNYLVTGKVYRAPNTHYHPWERLGFKRGDYTPVDGFIHLIARIFYLMDWFAPAIAAMYFFIVFRSSKCKEAIPEASCGRSAVVVGSSDPGSSPELCGNDKETLKALFRLGMVFFAFAYLFYYAWGGHQWGPRFYWEGMPFLCIVAADWIVIRWREGDLRARKFWLAFVITALATSGMIFVRQAEYVEESSRQRKELYVLAQQAITKPAIVFIHGPLGSRMALGEVDAVRNSPFLDTKIIYAHDFGERNRELMAAYPGREFYRGTYDRTLKKPKLVPI